MAVVLLLVVVLAAHGRGRSGGSERIVKLPVIDRHDIRFVQATTDGAPLETWITSIAQDRFGFIWIVGNGLYRYDGYSFKPYRHDPSDPSSLADDHARVVFHDRGGDLWVGTHFGGLDRLDPAAEKFRHYRHQEGVENTLIDNNVTCLFQDRQGALWIGTDRGLDRLDLVSGKFTHYLHDPRNANSLGSNSIAHITEDRRGDLWVATSTGVSRLDRATGHWKRYLPDPSDPQHLDPNQMTSVLEDRAGVIWAGSRSGLSTLDPNSGKFTRYLLRAGSSEPIGIDRLYQDRDGALWVATLDSGLFQLDQDRSRFLHYGREPANRNSLGNSLVSSLFQDAEGILWVGTASGLSRFSTKPPPFVVYRHRPGDPNSLRDNPVWSTMVDSKGFLWIGGVAKLNRLDRTSGRLTVYEHNSHDRYSLPNHPVSSLVEDRSGTLWVGSYGGGLNRLDTRTGKFLAYRRDPKRPGALSSDHVLRLFEDRQGTLWIGTQNGGLNRFNPAKHSFTSWQNDPKDPYSLSNSSVIAIAEDGDGSLWLGTLDGLNHFDARENRFTAYRNRPGDPRSLSNNKVNAVRMDRNGTIWAGTESGLNRFDRGRGEFTNFARTDGLPDDAVQSIQEDGEGYLWLATRNGLCRFDSRKPGCRNYSESDGLASNVLDFGSFRAANGELLYASSNGLTAFVPEKITANPYIPPVELTSFQLFNRTVNPGIESLLKQGVWATDSVTLTHAQSIFTIEFSGLSYAAPEKNRYRYRLEHFEREWNEVDYRRRLATYTTLPAGNYVFRVQASNNDGVWNQTGAALTVVVLPPWWGTWWFRIGSVVALVALAFFLYRSRLHRLQLSAERLEQQVAERTRELEVARDAAEAANRAKSAFLAKISHELRTPLTAILGFSALLRDGNLSENQRNDVDVINRSGEHLLSVINDVLDVAKIEAGRAELEAAPCDLTAMVREVMELMRVRAEAKGLGLLIRQSDAFPRYARADVAKLRQTFINLLGNAIKYTDQGSVTLHLDAKSADDPEHVTLAICVEDTGIGIAPEHQAGIFDAFVQVGNAAAQQGTGLGLTITRQLVELMGGTIRVESAPGAGARFFVELRVGRASEAEVLAEMAEDGHCVKLESGGPEYRVLIVEDDWESRTLLERLLQQAGFRVVSGSDGAQAVELFRSWRPHFIWMDLRMPVAGGLTAVERIREMEGGREVKIAAVTASAFEGERDAILASGMDDFVLKPYHPRDIFETLARHLGARYCGQQTAARSSADALRPEALAVLPHELRTELSDALLALDSARIEAASRRVSEVDSELGTALALHAERFAYTAIFHAIRKCEERAAANGRGA